MANYKMILQYDGTRYRGWQVLPAELTIQGKLQDVLSKMAGYQVEVTGSGRTDAGVHAKGQTANFHLREEWDEDKILFYLNQYLPEDIAVCEVKRVDERFHSRYQAVEKTYLYRIHTGKIPEVFERRYVYDYTEPLDVNRMRKAAEYLCGTHDFKSFCGNKKMKKSTVRTIYRIMVKQEPGSSLVKKSTVRTIHEISIEEIGGEIRFTYTGNGFLQNMVRILTGTLIEIGDGRRTPEDVSEILEAKNRERAGYTAPACGLTLLEVIYGKMVCNK